MKDDLGNRMKGQYENRTRYSLPRRTYTIIRLDGKAFHTFTQEMKKPFDEDFAVVMDRTAQFLCEEIQGAKMAYVQSDEISILLTDFDKITTDAWFDANIQKMVSVAASLATAKFNVVFNYDKDPSQMKMAFFDARVFTIPDRVEVENYFIWREKDATRNSISMTAQSLYSHKELEGKSSSDQQEMIHLKGQNWNDMPDGFKRGRIISYESDEMGDEYLPEDDQNWPSMYEWHIKPAPDFLKEREIFKKLIPEITHD